MMTCVGAGNRVLLKGRRRQRGQRTGPGKGVDGGPYEYRGGAEMRAGTGTPASRPQPVTGLHDDALLLRFAHWCQIELRQEGSCG